MQFEHLVEINNPDAAGIEILTPAQLWRGLLLRMEYPQQFQPGVQDCSVTRLDTDEWLRVIDYGRAQIRDRVRLIPEQAVEVEVLGSVGLKARLRIQIEQPQDRLWLRFAYTVESPEHQEGTQYADYIRAAYRQADEETVFRIRQLAATGVLGD